MVSVLAVSFFYGWLVGGWEMFGTSTETGMHIGIGTRALGVSCLLWPQVCIRGDRHAASLFFF